MALVNKPDESIFASSAKQGEVDNFPDLLRGWGITFDQTQGIPPMEWFNFLFKRLDEKHAYLMQRGLPEWSATQDYTKGSCVQFDGVSYRALKDSKNNSPNESDSQYWVRWGFALSEIARATLQQPGIVQLSSSTNSESESEAATSKAVKIAHELAESKQSPATTLAGYGINNFKVENGSGNMNDYRTDGIYCFRTLYGVSNSPRDTNSDIGSGNLQVITGGIGNERWCRQIFHVHYSKDTYIRWQVSVTNDDWSAWEKLNDIEPVIRALGTKANISHTHTANQITDFNQAASQIINAAITYQKIGDFEIRKYPDGTMIQTCRKHMLTGDYSKVNFNWAVAFTEMPILTATAQYYNSVGDHDTIITFVQGTSNSACHLVCGETYNNNGEIAYVNVVAIGRWK